MSIFDIFDQLNKNKAPEPSGPVEYIIAGLGNPGAEYENTRHNAGFMTVDTLAEKHGFEIKRLKFKSLTADVSIAGKRCLVMKPSTFMNKSGEAIVEAMNFYKIPIENVIICYDDISLEPGKIRIRRKGSDGGHNGIKSIIYLTGSQDFPRVKIGVGQKPTKEYDLASWVLGNFPSEDIPKLHEATDNACAALEHIVKGDIDKAMNLFNS
ncbi:MAG: aminoacyl-tRNA hydrolase [Oscillospiraceae bacterium]|nr:aminoacyl-tRNA hydrolase [Oscillospiraceae bacterium]